MNGIPFIFLIPVSYTHLDVYKRQVFLLLILAADIRIVYGARVSWKDYNIGQKGTERFAALEEIPVSYTHLDVYKRQPL